MKMNICDLKIAFLLSEAFFVNFDQYIIRKQFQFLDLLIQ